MALRELATSHVVDRCPSCGVEHEVRANECEACGSALRAWCRRHSHETGWLDGPACVRCVEEAARPVAAPVRPPAPAPAVATAPAAVSRGGDGVGKTGIAKHFARPPHMRQADYVASLTMLLLICTGGGIVVLILVLGDVAELTAGRTVAAAIAGGMYGVWCFALDLKKKRAKAVEREASARSSSSSP
jgi:hypothetical protein